MSSPRAPPDMEEDPMFVIKNLDTGLEMRIDDFDKLANIATDEVQEHEPAHKKHGLKGTKALKHWTTATAKKATAISKKAVSGIKEVAHDLNVQNVLSKHKAGHLPEPSPGKAAPSGTHSLADLLHRRSTGDSAAVAGSELFATSLASVAASEQSSNSSQAACQQTAASNISDSTVASVAAATSAGSVPVPSGPSLIATTLSAPLAAGPATQPSSANVSAGGAGQTAAAATVPAVTAPVRLISHKRSRQHVQDVVVAQVLEGNCGVVWAVAFSRDGSFLATAGQDGVVRVWQVTSSRDKEVRTGWLYNEPTEATTRRDSADETSSLVGDLIAQNQEQQQRQEQQHSEQQPGNNLQQAADTPQPPQQEQTTQDLAPQQSCSTEAQCVPTQQQVQQQQQQQHPQQHIAPPVVDFGPYFSQQPVREYAGHTEDVLDVSWSAGGFLLSASLDKSVRLWHVSQPDCLRQFWHSDFVTSVQFHPRDAQRFVSGSLDGKIRVWSVTENEVLATAQLHQDMVTAVGFSLNGGRVLAGTMRGRVRFYELADRKLEYVAQVDVRNQRGAHASGRKVTGIRAVPNQPQQFLITTNDSRLRLLEGYGQVLKFKGHKNSSTQLRANLSQDGRRVVCGSDDGWVYIWQLGATGNGSNGSTGSQNHSQLQRNGAGAVDRSARSALAAAAVDGSGSSSGGKNAVYQAFQAFEAGVPVTAVAFAPPGVCDGQPSVLVGNNSAGALSGGAGLEAPEVVVARPGFAGRTVQHVLVSAGFSGAIKVHELL